MDCRQQIRLSLIYLGLVQQAINQPYRLLFSRHCNLYGQNITYQLLSRLSNVEHLKVYSSHTVQNISL
jgi:hypothetical protein